MAASRKRRVDAEMVFQGQAISPDLLPSLWNEGEQQICKMRRIRQDVARGLRLKTHGIQLKESWVRRHPDAAEWVVKYLPERRTLERDLIASVAAIEPVYDRVPIGPLQRDDDHAEALANYMETWRKRSVPYQTFAEKDTEDGEHGVVVLPSDIDMDGDPSLYDHLSEDDFEALDEDEQAEYTPDEDDPQGRYVGRTKDGAKRKNPKYDRGDGDEKFQERLAEARQRYLLNLDQDAVSIRVIPASDCIPFLVRGTRRERWQVHALLERTLYYPVELEKQFGWVGLGDRTLIPKGFDPTRTTGQNGQFYLYTLYMVWRDTEHPDPKKRRIERPIIAYSVGGSATWSEEPEKGQLPPDNGVAILDLYESHGLTGPFWWYGGGLHTSDDDPDMYWEPYLWPFAETIMGIEGLKTMGNAATAVNAVTGYYYKPEAALVELDDQGLVDADTGRLIVPEIPDAGDIATIAGDMFPASPASVSPDLWRVIQLEEMSLRENTVLEQPGGGQQASGRSMIVKETIGQTAKRHIRESAKDAVQFCGERALRIFAAAAKVHKVKWPIQTTEERPVGQELRTSTAILEFDPDWVGEGEYALSCEYPQEENPVRVEQALSKIAAGVGSFEELCDASGITDVETAWSKVLKTRIRMDPRYLEAQVTRLAKLQGNQLMLKIVKLQQQQRMTQGGPPGFEQGVASAALNRPGEGGTTGIGGPTTAERSLGGIMSSEIGPAKQDAQMAMQAAAMGGR